MDATDRFGNTPLHAACDAAALGAVLTLRDFGASSLVQNVLNESPLGLCALRLPQAVPALLPPPTAPPDPSLPPFTAAPVHLVPLGWLRLLRSDPSAAAALPWSDLVRGFETLLQRVASTGAPDAWMAPHWVPAPVATGGATWTSGVATLVAFALEANHAALDTASAKALRVASEIALASGVTVAAAAGDSPAAFPEAPSLATLDRTGAPQLLLPQLLRSGEDAGLVGDANGAVLKAQRLLRVVMKLPPSQLRALGLSCPADAPNSSPGPLPASCLYAAHTAAAVRWLVDAVGCTPHAQVRLGDTHAVWVQALVDTLGSRRPPTAGRLEAVAALAALASGQQLELSSNDAELLRRRLLVPTARAPSSAVPDHHVRAAVAALIAAVEQPHKVVSAVRLIPAVPRVPSTGTGTSRHHSASWMWSFNVVADDDAALLPVQQGLFELVAAVPAEAGGWTGHVLVSNTTLCGCDGGGGASAVSGVSGGTTDCHRLQWVDESPGVKVVSAPAHLLHWRTPDVWFVQVCSDGDAGGVSLFGRWQWAGNQ